MERVSRLRVAEVRGQFDGNRGSGKSGKKEPPGSPRSVSRMPARWLKIPHMRRAAADPAAHRRGDVGREFERSFHIYRNGIDRRYF